MFNTVVFKLIFRLSNTTKKQKLFPHLTKRLPAEPKVYPNQYPVKINDSSLSLISRERPVRFVTPKDEVIEDCDIPHNIRAMSQTYKNKWESPPNSYSLNIGVLGLTNSGKSALVGRLAHKISAVSPKAHTTGQVINVIKSYEVNEELGLKNVQLNYFDTPGLLEKRGGYSSKHWGIINDIDFALLVIDSNKRFEEGIRIALERLDRRGQQQPLLKALVLNKIDLMTSRNRFNTLIGQIERFGKFDSIFYTSTETGYGISELQKYLVSMARPGQWQYPAEARTTLTERQIYQEMMREAIYHRTYQQIPHTMSIELKAIAKKSNGRDYIKFKLGVHSENQMRLVIGTKGNNINVIKNLFIKQYCKDKDAEPDVDIQVSIMDKYQQRLAESEETVSSQDEFKRVAESELKQLHQKLKTKFGGKPTIKPPS